MVLAEYAFPFEGSAKTLNSRATTLCSTNPKRLNAIGNTRRSSRSLRSRSTKSKKVCQNSESATWVCLFGAYSHRSCAIKESSVPRDHQTKTERVFPQARSGCSAGMSRPRRCSPTPRSSCRGPASARQPSCLEQRKLDESRLRHAALAAQLSVRYVGWTECAGHL